MGTPSPPWQHTLAGDIAESRDLFQSDPQQLRHHREAFRDIDENIRGYHQVLPVKSAR